MSLREKLIEAGASVITIDMDSWEEDEIAAVILDAFLDCLAENPDEWKCEAARWWFERLDGDTAILFDLSGLLAVLRESDDV